MRGRTRDEGCSHKPKAFMLIRSGERAGEPPHHYIGGEKLRKGRRGPAQAILLNFFVVLKKQYTLFGGRLGLRNGTHRMLSQICAVATGAVERSRCSFPWAAATRVEKRCPAGGCNHYAERGGGGLAKSLEPFPYAGRGPRTLLLVSKSTKARQASGGLPNAMPKLERASKAARWLARQ
ncbi:hypothetical protein L7F22_054411 [Adiantum nelumboides]|nr:hypothetical protein [Adiantum nelumboides]